MANVQPADALQPNATVTVDVVLFTVRPDEPISRSWQVLLVEPKDRAFGGRWSLPGARVHEQETFDAAARRALQHKAGLDARSWYLEQVGTFGAPARDTRGRVISVAHVALVSSHGVDPVPGGGVMRADWAPVRGLPAESLAFDHADIVRVAVNRVQSKLRYSWLAFQLLPETFTLPELRAVYGAILDPALLRLNTGNFKKAFKELFASGVLERVGVRSAAGRVGRPGDLYRFSGPVLGTWSRELPWHTDVATLAAVVGGGAVNTTSIQVPELPPALVTAKVEEALREDLGADGVDLTSDLVVPADLGADAVLLAKAPGVLAGVPLAVEVFRQVDPDLQLDFEVGEGAALQPGQRVARASGRLRSLLRAERVALNFLQQLSGVATLTHRFVEAAPGVAILNTRKTVPGLRALQRYAVAVGGGTNHRRGLDDAILIKDNHLHVAGGVTAAVERAHAAGLPVEIEVETLEQLAEAVAARPRVVLLDNMPVERVREAVRQTGGRVLLEVSGGVRLETVAAYAATGVDRISVGELTHSAPALDLSLEVTATWHAK